MAKLASEHITKSIRTDVWFAGWCANLCPPKCDCKPGRRALQAMRLIKQNLLPGAYHITESMHTLNDMTSHDELAIGHPYEETPEYSLHGANGHSNYVDQHDFYLSSNVILDGKFQSQYSPHKLYPGRGSHFYSGNYSMVPA